MRIMKCLMGAIPLTALLIAGSAFAYSDDDEKDCRKPRFRTFEPVHLSEVEPESEISFHVSNWADPETITAEARKIPMQVKVEDKMNFFVGTARLPASVAGKYARIHITAKAQDGRCLGQDGWLLKVKKTAQLEQPKTEEPAVDSTVVGAPDAAKTAENNKD